ncbi:proton-conducting transporter membrane subunit [Candidatus Deferrimicrobium sp.]|uniref:proton-conducting transporter transmembrane domain-containing protein n=1 Tax=Candidatus Deferrimicrobium sp. TaxID=3060586 RepID=UPI002ED0AD3D
MIPLLLIAPLAGLIMALLSRAPWQAALGTVLGSAGLLSGAVIQGVSPRVAAWGELLRLDELGSYFLLIVAGVHFLCSVYSYGYFRRELEGGGIGPSKVRMYHVWINLFVLSMVVVVCSHHLALQWVAVEATTLFSAPLIYLHGDRRGMEAAWKYLLICSVGIALAFLGIIFLSRAAGDVPLTYTALPLAAKRLDLRFLRLAFLFFLVGYGTKMGLAPMHTWLPDAHSQAPAPASAMLSGVLLNCALLSILRIAPAIPGPYASPLLILFGILSIAVPALLVAVQRDIKRLLAFSSIENMGIVVLGIGFGGAARPAALLHVLNHSVAKVLLFLVAGDLILRFGTQKIRHIHGILRETPLRGVLLFGGILAITGSPPFGAFWSEFGILVGGIAGGHMAVSLAYLVLLAILFGSFLMYGSDMVFGEGVPRKLAVPELWCLLPACVLLLASLWLGLHVPAGLYKTLERLSTVIAFS